MFIKKFTKIVDGLGFCESRIKTQDLGLTLIIKDLRLFLVTY